MVGFLLLELGGGLMLRSGGTGQIGAAPAAAGGGAAATPGGRDVLDSTPLRAQRVRTAATPLVLRLTQLGVTARVVGVSVGPEGALSVPSDPHVVGWWQGGARPGGGEGSIVLGGHVDDARLGEGALFTLRLSRLGDTLRLRDASGNWWDYVVADRLEYRKGNLPAGELFTQGGPERLVLVTCGGPFDRRTRQYADNVVVVAVPAKG